MPLNQLEIILDYTSNLKKKQTTQEKLIKIPGVQFSKKNKALFQHRPSHDQKPRKSHILPRFHRTSGPSWGKTWSKKKITHCPGDVFFSVWCGSPRSVLQWLWSYFFLFGAVAGNAGGFLQETKNCFGGLLVQKPSTNLCSLYVISTSVANLYTAQMCLTFISSHSCLDPQGIWRISGMSRVISIESSHLLPSDWMYHPLGPPTTAQGFSLAAAAVQHHRPHHSDFGSSAPEIQSVMWFDKGCHCLHVM